MTPRQPEEHWKARYNRELKASKLAGKIVELATDGVTPLEVFGRLTPAQWVNVEVLIGQKKPKVPSPQCQLIVLEKLREHSRGAAA